MSAADISDFNLLVVGDSGVGKTTYLMRLLTGAFELRHVPSLRADVHPLEFFTHFGSRFRFHCWDIGGAETLDGRREGYYVHGHCAIIMFDVTARMTFRNVPTWQRDVERVCEDIPIVLCGTKVDLAERRTRVKQISFSRTTSLPYFEISSTLDSEEQLREPFAWLVRRLTGDESITLVDAPALCCPNQRMYITAEQIARLYAETAAAAAAVPLSDNDEDL